MIRLPHEQQRIQNVQRIVSALKRADRMIQNLLDSTRVQSGLQLDLERKNTDLTMELPNSIEELSRVYRSPFILHMGKNLAGERSPLGIRRIIEDLAVKTIKHGASNQVVTIRTQIVNSALHLGVHD